MQLSKEKAVKRYMYSQIVLRPEIFEYVGEVQRTELAEDAAQEFDLYANDEIPEYVFEWAHEVAEEYERAERG